jgi:putative exosortase-associated protein (TIGR04073 family)
MRVGKLVLLTAVALFMITAVRPAWSIDDAGPMRKLGRGISNSFLFLVEVPNQILKAYESDGPVAAASYGVVKGLGRSVLRAFVGLYETATFFIPLPKHYEPILTNPEFLMEDWHA